MGPSSGGGDTLAAPSHATPLPASSIDTPSEIPPAFGLLPAAYTNSDGSDVLQFSSEVFSPLGIFDDFLGASPQPIDDPISDASPAGNAAAESSVAFDFSVPDSHTVNNFVQSCKELAVVEANPLALPFWDSEAAKRPSRLFSSPSQVGPQVSISSSLNAEGTQASPAAARPLAGKTPDLSCNLVATSFGFCVTIGDSQDSSHNAQDCQEAQPSQPTAVLGSKRQGSPDGRANIASKRVQGHQKTREDQEHARKADKQTKDKGREPSGAIWQVIHFPLEAFKLYPSLHQCHASPSPASWTLPGRLDVLPGARLLVRACRTMLLTMVHPPRTPNSFNHSTIFQTSVRSNKSFKLLCPLNLQRRQLAPRPS